MEDEPLRLLSELRSPQHRPPMLAFAIVAIACAVVIATGIRFESVGSLFGPVPRSLGAALLQEVQEQRSSVPDVQAGSVIEPEETAEDSASPAPAPAGGRSRR